MAEYGRYGDYETRERSRHDERGRSNRSMFGSSGRGEDDWNRGRREEMGWGSSGSRSSHDERSRRDEGSWWGGDNDRSAREGQQASRGRGYGSDDHRDGLAIDETSRLIASNKVEGTAVYDRDGHRLGSVYNFMVDKYTGRVDYAVMSYGGFLGMGTRYYPIPWQMLKYDVREGGYRVDLRERDLERAPSFDRSSEPSFDRRYGERVHGWYGLNY
jgi:sporulation protein YlmC with PRC-barrel domain